MHVSVTSIHVQGGLQVKPGTGNISPQTLSILDKGFQDISRPQAELLIMIMIFKIFGG